MPKPKPAKPTDGYLASDVDLACTVVASSETGSVRRRPIEGKQEQSVRKIKAMSAGLAVGQQERPNASRRERSVAALYLRVTLRLRLF